MSGRRQFSKPPGTQFDPAERTSSLRNSQAQRPANDSVTPAKPRPQKREAQRTRLILQRGDSYQAIHIHPGVITGGAVALALFTLLYCGSTAYLAFRDHLVTAVATDDSDLRERYEDRISALRGEIERMTSRRLIDHATVEQKVEHLLDRQDALDERQKLIAKLTDAARRAGIDIPPVATDPLPAGDGKQSSLDTIASPKVAFASMTGTPADDKTSPEAVAAMDKVDAKITGMEEAQSALLTGLAARVTARADRLQSLVTRLGRTVPKSVGAEDVGGPLVPLATADPADRFEYDVDALSDQFDRLAAIRKVALALPIRPPIPGAEITSPFGPRRDPFLGRPAMHTGIDFRAPEGSAARAVAAGTVVAAEYNGGYGNMVDIDHGNGIVTRYGHLSAISVRVGQKVAQGGRIGRVGSTGRSTGPHLHYEIRIDGEPINPMRYLTAGQQIAALL